MGKKFDIALENQILRMYDEGKMSATQIGKSLGIYTTSIVRVLKRNNRKICTNKGKDHPNWRGGRGLKSGYWCVYKPNQGIMFKWSVVAIALTGTILNVMQNKICFAFWIVSNFLLCLRNIKIKEYPQAVLFGIYFALAIFGILNWK